MQQIALEPLRWDELVKFGEDRGFEKGLAAGLERGIEQGIEQGIKQGMRRGLAQGLEQGLEFARRVLVDALETRGFPLHSSVYERIAAERSPEQLLRWCRQALQACSLEEVFLSR